MAIYCDPGLKTGNRVTFALKILTREYGTIITERNSEVRKILRANHWMEVHELIQTVETKLCLSHPNKPKR